MELWIRSQDKEKLVLTKGFEIQHTNYDGGCQIFAVWQNNYQMVGKYKNKERALEGLDEIQIILRGKYATSFDYKTSLKGFKPKDIEHMLELMAVYEMPKE